MMLLLTLVSSMLLNAASIYEYRRQMREGAEREVDELKAVFEQQSKIIRKTVKVDKQTDKKVLEIPYRENLLLKREQYKVENGVI